MRVLVLGAGAIGTSVAYCLASRGAQVTVVERTAVACAASGRSGGFLALDWCDGTPLQALARRSFALHAEFADRLQGDWGYRRLTTFGGTVGEAGTGGTSAHRPAWVSPAVRIQGRLGSPETTAQVHPAAFTTGMMRAAEAHGASLLRGEVTEVMQRNGRVTGAWVDGTVLEADAVVVAMGPWSVLAAQWLPLPAVFGLKGHSLVFDTGGEVPPQALFLEAREDDGSLLSPEVFPRADGSTYVCAISTEAPLPLDPAEVGPDAGALERLRTLCGRISPMLGRAPVVAGGACFRPITQDGAPLIGALRDPSGAFVATGHSVWGILNAPATGEALAELILDGRASHVDLSRFDPGRLPTLDPARVSQRPRAPSRAQPALQ